MNEYKLHREELAELMRAQDEAGQVPCENLPDAYYVDDQLKENNNHLKALALNGCSYCPIAAQCAAYGIRWEEYGIWGGLTEADRKQARRNLQARGVELPSVIRYALI